MKHCCVGNKLDTFIDTHEAKNDLRYKKQMLTADKSLFSKNKHIKYNF